ALRVARLLVVVHRKRNPFAAQCRGERVNGKITGGGPSRSGTSADHPVDQPIGPCDPDTIGRDPKRGRHGRLGETVDRGEQREGRGDHEKLAGLDTEVESEQRGGDLALWQSDGGKRAREAETVEQAEGKGDR